MSEFECLQDNAGQAGVSVVVIVIVIVVLADEGYPRTNPLCFPSTDIAPNFRSCKSISTDWQNQDYGIEFSESQKTEIRKQKSEITNQNSIFRFRLRSRESGIWIQSGMQISHQLRVNSVIRMSAGHQTAVNQSGRTMPSRPSNWPENCQVDWLPQIQLHWWLNCSIVWGHLGDQQWGLSQKRQGP